MNSRNFHTLWACSRFCTIRVDHSSLLTFSRQSIAALMADSGGPVQMTMPGSSAGTPRRHRGQVNEERVNRSGFQPAIVTTVV